MNNWLMRCRRGGGKGRRNESRLDSSAGFERFCVVFVLYWGKGILEKGMVLKNDAEKWKNCRDNVYSDGGDNAEPCATAEKL